MHQGTGVQEFKEFKEFKERESGARIQESGGVVPKLCGGRKQIFRFSSGVTEAANSDRLTLGIGYLTY
jgi:hypothetical protein